MELFCDTTLSVGLKESELKWKWPRV